MAKDRWYILNGMSFKRNVKHSLTCEEYREIFSLIDGD